MKSDGTLAQLYYFRLLYQPFMRSLPTNVVWCSCCGVLNFCLIQDFFHPILKSHFVKQYWHGKFLGAGPVCCDLVYIAVVTGTCWTEPTHGNVHMQPIMNSQLQHGHSSKATCGFWTCELIHLHLLNFILIQGFSALAIFMRHAWSSCACAFALLGCSQSEITYLTKPVKVYQRDVTCTAA